MGVDLLEKANKYLGEVCEGIGERCVGSRGNQAATGYFARSMEDAGFDLKISEFTCFEWSHAGASLEVEGESFQVSVSPYSLGCLQRAPLCSASSLEELKTVDPAGKILLLSGELTREPLMPKNFPFYNPAEHQLIVRLLEMGGCRGIAAATSRNPAMAGGLYPFPFIEDGDFNVPSVYMTEREGERLLRRVGREGLLEINAVRVPSKGCNVTARRGRGGGWKVVIFAHIDTKQGTPGALDNGAGVVVLILLAHMLQGYNGSLQVELVALNGEDYYSNPGQMLYLEENRHGFSDILLGVNIDGPGYREGDTAFSMYECPPFLEEPIRRAFSADKGMVEGEPWLQGDHGLFLINNRPALALTSERLDKVLEISHTPSDKRGVVAAGKLVAAAGALRRLIEDLNNEAPGRAAAEKKGMP